MEKQRGTGWRIRSVQAASLRRALAIEKGLWKKGDMKPLWVPHEFQADVKAMIAGKLSHAERDAQVLSHAHTDVAHTLHGASSRALAAGVIDSETRKADKLINKKANLAKHVNNPRQLSWASGSENSCRLERLSSVGGKPGGFSLTDLKQLHGGVDPRPLDAWSQNSTDSEDGGTAHYKS